MLSKKLYKKYKNTKNKFIIETIFQLYLMEMNIRNICQIFIGKRKLHNTNKEINNLILFLNKYKITYILGNYAVIIYDKNKLNINDINHTWGKKYEKQLGLFYKCATNNFSKNNIRIVIHVFSNKGHAIELFAQMCNEKQIKKYFATIYNIYNDIYNTINLLDKEVFCDIQFYKIV